MIDRITERWSQNKEDAKLFAQEEFILDVTEAIWEQLEKQELTQAELATALNQTSAHISQLLNGGRNMTLRTLSDIARALGLRPKFLLCDEERYNGKWSQDDTIYSTGQTNPYHVEIDHLSVNDAWSNVVPLRRRQAA